MPYEITFDNIPAGYSLSSSKKGETGTIQVSVREFTSSEDGDLFISRLEGFPEEIVSKLPPRISPSQIDHLLAIIRKDKTATVYVNEIKKIAKILIKRVVDKGEPVYADDIGDVESLILEGISLPEDVSILFLFSVGWRKGLFFDFWPTQSHNPRNRDYDLNNLLGQYYAYLIFQDFFKIPDAEWTNLLKQGWFPFITLRKATLKDILNYNRNLWNIDELLPKIEEEITDRLPVHLIAWQNNTYFNDHLKFIETAIERFKSKDYISVISILFPRIEGLMRSFHQDIRSDVKSTQASLIDSIVPPDVVLQKPHSLLLPQKFREYLIDVFFANFNPNSDKPLSRHSVSHGVASASDFSLKGATLGFLTLTQLSYYLKPNTWLTKAST